MNDRLTQKDMEQIKGRVGEDRITTKDIEVQRNIKKFNKLRKRIGKDRLTAKDIEEAGGFNKGGMAEYIKDLL